MTREEQNIQIIRRWCEAWNRHDVEAVTAMHPEDFENHGRVVGHAGVTRVLGDILERFPDVRLTIEEIIATGDDVVVRLTYAGTHLGVGRLPIDGGFMIGVAPTGRTFAVQHIHWFTLRDGLISRHRASRDDAGMLVQLGLIPPPPAFAPPAFAPPAA